MDKPQIITKLKKGKSIGAFIGLTDTINWTTESVSNLKGKDGIKIDWGDGSHPTIKLEGSAGIKFVGTDESEAEIGDNPQSTINFHNANENVNLTINVTESSDSVDIYITPETPQTTWYWLRTLKTFIHPHVQINRTIYTVSVSSNLSDGSYYVMIDHATKSVSLVQGNGFDPSADTTYFWIADIAGGELVSGICSMPVLYLYE